ncbi:phage major capsid protein [Micromonospora aurantiaca (nom. illeg.)]|uniref:phage major capsid protein n=1 Tax=Micromonospora aurantiaca (nom. illeg.) TaxID=47850 RepID=UPI0033E36F75
MDPLEILRQRLEELRSQINTKRSRATEILGMKTEDLNDALMTEASNLRKELAADQARAAEIEGQIKDEETEAGRREARKAAQVDTGTVPTPEARGVGGAKVAREERTYSRDKTARGETSFFADAYRAQFMGDQAAAQRLARHGQEQAVEGEGVSARATTTGSFAGLVPPQYLVDLYAPIQRNGSPMANLLDSLPLPPTGMTVSIPRATTGAAVASQATENSALQNTDEVWADLSVPVRTIGGQQDVSRQSLERGTPGIDLIVFRDLAAAYYAELDRQIIAGSGASGQMLGITQTVGIFQAAAYTAAATAATFYKKTAGVLAAVAGAGTEIVPSFWLMNPRRWYWLSSEVDSQGRPLVVPLAGGAMNAMAANTYPGGTSADGGQEPPRPVGIYHGLPVYTDANVPTSVGTGPEDLVIAGDVTKGYLWEDNNGVPRQLKFEQTLGQNLTVKLVLFNYAAFTAGRYPAAFGVAGGNAGTAGFGQVAPAF